jgi:hypothetical protein
VNENLPGHRLQDSAIEFGTHIMAIDPAIGNAFPPLAAGLARILSIDVRPQPGFLA